MNYRALYEFISDLSQNLGVTAKFFHGRKEIITQTTPDDGLYIYSFPFVSSGDTTGGAQINEEWEVSLIFYQLDLADSAIDQNDQDVKQEEIRTLEVTNLAADKYLRLVHGNDISDDLGRAAEQLTIRSFTKENAIKDTAQLLTGTVLTLRLIVPDNFDYCNPDSYA